MRWKAHFFDNVNVKEDNENLSFCLKSSATPPVNPHLADFENDLYELVKNIEFRKVKNDFLDKLKSDIKEIQS